MIENRKYRSLAKLNRLATCVPECFVSFTRCGYHETLHHRFYIGLLICFFVRFVVGVKREWCEQKYLSLTVWFISHIILPQVPGNASLSFHVEVKWKKKKHQNVYFRCQFFHILVGNRLITSGSFCAMGSVAKIKYICLKSGSKCTAILQ